MSKQRHPMMDSFDGLLRRQRHHWNCFEHFAGRALRLKKFPRESARWERKAVGHLHEWERLKRKRDRCMMIIGQWRRCTWA